MMVILVARGLAACKPRPKKHPRAAATCYLRLCPSTEADVDGECEWLSEVRAGRREDG